MLEFCVVRHDGRAAVRRAMSRFHQEAQTASSLLAVRRTRRRRRRHRQLRGLRRRGSGRAVAERSSAGAVDDSAAVRHRRPSALPAERARRLRLRGGRSTTYEHAKCRRGLRRAQTECRHRRQDALRIQGLSRRQLGAQLRQSLAQRFSTSGNPTKRKFQRFREQELTQIIGTTCRPNRT